MSDLSIRDLEKNEYVRVVKMENAGHFGYEGEELETMLREFGSMIQSVM